MSHRAPLLQLLQTYQTRFPDEQATVQQLASFVESEPACFERSTLAGHVTGSAWILNAAGSHVLLTHHAKLNIWVQLGGHADGDADVARVAMREAEEESGVAKLALVSPELFDIDIHEIPARGSEPAHFHYDCRFMIRADSDEFVISDESHALAWIAVDDITSVTQEASMLRMAEKSAAFSR